MIALKALSLALGFLLLFALVNSQQLRVEYLSSKLPITSDCHRVHYDGQDSIYIIGVGIGSASKQILKYSFETDTIEEYGTLSNGFCGGSVQTADDNNLFLFGYNNSGQVMKYNIRENSETIVATLPYNIFLRPTIQSCNSNKNIVHILGAAPNTRKILSFNLGDYTFAEPNATLPFDLYNSEAVCVDDRAFVFPTFYNGNQSVWEFDLTTLDLNPIGQPDLPLLSSHHSPIFDGNFVYVVAGYRLDGSSPILSQEGILRFDPSTNSTSFIPVENWPVQDEGNERFTIPPQCVYISKLNRIYCFGGFSITDTTGEYRNHDEIFYIDLEGESATTLSPPDSTTLQISSTTMNPDLFSCLNRPNGFYPHPSDCSLFIGCKEGEMDFFSCNPPLLFNPVFGICDFPEFVDCGLTCVGKVDGAYPHPRDCSLYLLCHSEVMRLAKCPPPLLFDPTLSVCNYPEDVECSSN